MFLSTVFLGSTNEFASRDAWSAVSCSFWSSDGHLEFVIVLMDCLPESIGFEESRWLGGGAKVSLKLLIIRSSCLSNADDCYNLPFCLAYFLRREL